MNPKLEARIAARAVTFGLSASALLERDAPGGLAVPGSISANRHCRLLQVRDGWIALNLARPEDVELVPALTGSTAPPWPAVAQMALSCRAVDFRDRASELHLPVAIVGEARPIALAPPGARRMQGRVIDLSALWAGPLCAGLLARAGADVVRIESLGRPDPTPVASPRLDVFLNGAKARLPLDLRSEAGRGRLLEEIADAAVLVTSARPSALARLGLRRDDLAKRFPELLWVAITAHGSGSERVGFGDDCAAAGGLVNFDREQPCFMGDALADPLTGIEAAIAALAQWHEGRGGFIDMAMSGVAAAYAAGLSVESGPAC